MIMNNDWDQLFDQEIQKDYLLNLRYFLAKEYKTKNIYPAKENIFAKSREIELKKAIVIFLKNNVHNNNNIKLIKMTTADNLIDEFYRYVTDHEDLGREEAMNKYLENYIK